MKVSPFTPCMLAMCVVVSLTEPSFAQVNANVQVQVAGGGPGIGIDTQRHSTTDPKQMALFLQMHIELMDSVCDLDDAQAKKLALGGKSAAKKLLARGGKKFPLGLPFAGGGQLEVQENSLSDEDSETRDETDSDVEEVANIRIPTSLQEVLKQPLWKKVVKSVLQPEQQQRWSDYQTNQKSELRSLLVDHRVAQLQHDLYLTSDQIEKVTQLVDRIEGEQLLESFNQGTNAFVKIAMGDEKEISKEDWKGVLTQTQMKVWESRNSMGGFHGMIGNILGVPAKKKEVQSRDLGVEISNGLQVKSVKEDSLAAAIGVQQGDVIDSINGDPVDTLFQLKSALKAAKQVRSVLVIRSGKSMLLENK